MDHRYRGKMKFTRGNSYGPFYIDQCEPKPEKAGEGPYSVYYEDAEVWRVYFHGDCKYWVEDLVNDYREVTREIQKSKTEFCEKWNLPDFPENLVQ